MASGEPILGSLFVYAPNKVAPIIFTVTYAISTGFHIWQCWRYGAWKLAWLHPLCGLLFTAGYALREYGAHNYIYEDKDMKVLIIYIMSQVFIYICPPLLELSNYHVLGRMFFYIPHCSPLPPGKVLSTFGGVMLIVETLNSLGVSLAANPSSSAATQTAGSNLTIAAIATQIAVIAVFCCLAAIFHRRCAKAGLHVGAISTLLVVLYVSMALIFIRCVYRLVEHTGDTSIDMENMEALKGLSPILRYEGYFLVFEATLMLLNSVLWNIWHPGRFLPNEHHVYLDLNGERVHGEEEADGRPLWAKSANIASFGILFRKKKSGAREGTELPSRGQSAKAQR